MTQYYEYKTLILEPLPSGAALTKLGKEGWRVVGVVPWSFAYGTPAKLFYTLERAAGVLD